tara:strand:+ start:20750 stop:21103 length:354 start_codon:yes stop_codon:yes gene_type:complete
MGSGVSKQNKELHNRAFDLIDIDGNEIIYKNEIQQMSKWFHTYMVNNSARDHNILSKKDPSVFLYEKIEKPYGTPLKRKDFNIIANMISIEKWHTEVIPLLRNKEIERLSKERNDIN